MRRDSDRQAPSQRLYHLTENLEDLRRQLQPFPVRANQGRTRRPPGRQRSEHAVKPPQALRWQYRPLNQWRRHGNRITMQTGKALRAAAPRLLGQWAFSCLHWARLGSCWRQGWC